MAALIPALSHHPPAAGATPHRALGLRVADAVTYPTVGPGHHPIGPFLVHRRDASGLAPTRVASAARPVAAAVPVAVHPGLGAQSQGPLRRRVGERLRPVDGAAAIRGLYLVLLPLLVVILCLVAAGGIRPLLYHLRLVEAVINPSPARELRQGATFPEGEAIRGLRLAGGNSFIMASAAMPWV